MCPCHRCAVWAPRLTNVTLQGKRNKVKSANWEVQMFTSLDEEIKRDDQATTTLQERRLFYVVVLLVSSILFGGLYAGLKYLE